MIEKWWWKSSSDGHWQIGTPLETAEHTQGINIYPDIKELRSPIFCSRDRELDNFEQSCKLYNDKDDSLFNFLVTNLLCY